MKKTIQAISFLLLSFLRLLILIYRYSLSPLLGPNKCRYDPTCSAYALEAIKIHGWKGCWLAAKRVTSCHPWGGYGYDPVPEKKHRCDSEH